MCENLFRRIKVVDKRQDNKMVSCTRLQLGRRAFSVAGPSSWTCLPPILIAFEPKTHGRGAAGLAAWWAMVPAKILVRWAAMHLTPICLYVC